LFIGANVGVKDGYVEDSQALRVGREEDGMRQNSAGPSSLCPWIVLGWEDRIAAEERREAVNGLLRREKVVHGAGFLG
jgi:hypothetical protein